MVQEMDLPIDTVALLGIVAFLVLVNSKQQPQMARMNARLSASKESRSHRRWRRAARPSFREQRITEPPAVAARGARIPHEDADLSRGEVKMVMKRLGIFGVADDPGSEKLQERIGATEIARVFEEDEVSLEEVKEAFYVFDGNCDGFVDARELSNVLQALGFVHLSEHECGDLIKAFDENGDGLIDFREFAKLVQRSFRH
ncbi:hypothetical protein NL676_029038 [Syzygium grande]|nr:hypothetical protein NL676_029038 [Syzygium grande]